MDDPSQLAFWASLLAGAVIGAWAGFSATSGWIVVFPLLFVVAERPLFECLLASLVVDWSCAFVAAVSYVRRGDADVGFAVRWAAISVPLVLLGVGIAVSVLPHLDSLLGGISGPIAIGMGLLLLRRAWRSGAPPTVDAQDAQPTEGPRHATGVLRAGLVANGTLMGILGQSGGLNTALLLIWLRGKPTRAAVATAVLLGAIVLPVGIAAYLWVTAGAGGLWPVLGPFALASIAASATAAHQVAHIPERRLEFVVAFCVLLAGTVATAQRWIMPV